MRLRFAGYVLLKSLAKKNRTRAEASWLNGNEEEARVSEWLPQEGIADKVFTCMYAPGFNPQSKNH